MLDPKLYTSPLPLEPVRVRRTYRGGSGLDRWHGAAQPQESNRPEEWLASMTGAVNPGFPPMENEGLSSVELPGRRVLLRELAAQAPEQMLGRAHVQRYGLQPGVLAKLIDSAERLSIQVHPDREFARRHFHSEYGKTECWHILSTRPVDGRPPCLMLGFRPGITRAMWEDIYRRQDIPAMLNCLHCITPKPGETWLIRGGMPHAIGPGCTLVEIQEPTDYTLRSERTQADGTPIPDALIHQGLGERALMDCFHYDGMQPDELQASCRLAPQSVHYGGGSLYQLLVGPRDTPCFSMERLEIREPLHFSSSGSFSCLVVLEGSGTLLWAGSSLNLSQGQQLFLPAGLDRFALAPAEGQMTAVRCHPPACACRPPVADLPVTQAPHPAPSSL